MSYDDWKTRSPDDEIPPDYDFDLRRARPPEVFVECEQCGGAGDIEVYQDVSKWSIDPACAQVIVCPVCDGSGGYIDEAPGDPR